MTFSIYATAIGGAALWTESQAITFDNGYYATTLGAVQAFSPTLFSGSTLFLAVRSDIAARAD